MYPSNAEDQSSGVLESNGNIAIVTTIVNNNNNNTTTRVVGLAQDGPIYVRCDSTGPFVNPLSANPSKTAAEINRTQLNLNLGQNLVTRDNRKLIQTIRFLNKYLISWWEHILFRVWNTIPDEIRRKIQYYLWTTIYFPLHKHLLGRATAIHRDASPEYHALTTFMWGGRFFPVSVPRMRFALHQLTTWQPQPLQSVQLETICENVAGSLSVVPDIQTNHCVVRGLYLHHQPPKSHHSYFKAAVATEYILFWLYGGAFLAGDAQGNTGPANYIANHVGEGMDVFIPTYRLAPESDINDILWDVLLAYRWLCHLRRRRGQDPSKIIMFGCSSGAGLVVRILQSIAEAERDDILLPSYLCVDGAVQPKGAVLASPFVDYTTNKHPNGSFHQYSRHDLIVNESVLEIGLPYLETHMAGHPMDHSPVNRSFVGLPKLCVLVSEHETVYDETCVLVNRARAAGVPVTVGLWQYMCHVWLFLHGFTPEGKQAMSFIVDWIQELQQIVSCQKC